MMSTRRGAAALATVLLAVLPLAGCGSNDTPLCSSIDELSASIDQLGVIQLGENGRDQLESQLVDVRADLAQVRTDAQQQYGDQVAAVTAAADLVRERYQGAKAEPSASTLQPLRTAITNLGTELSALQDAVAGTC